MDVDATAVRASLEDPERFSVIFERHHRVVWTYLARLAGADTADEIAGEVFTTAFEHRDRFDPARGEVRSWLYGIATNKLRTRFRSDRRARRAFARAAEKPTAPDPTGLVDDAAELADTARKVVAAMARLKREDRDLFVLYAWEELSYGQIAEVLGVPIGTVRSRLSRARQKLRELLVDTGEVFSEHTL